MRDPKEETGAQGKLLLSPMLAGASAGVVARLVCHPIDTIRSQVAVQTSATRAPIVSALTRTLQAEGVAGLYRGIGIAAVGSAPALALYFTTYEVAKERLRKVPGLSGETSFIADFGAGFVAETVACILFVPIDLVKERLQVQASLQGAASYKGSVHAIRTVIRAEGVRGIYRGYLATLASFGPFSGLYFLFYEEIKRSSELLRRSRVGADSEPSPHMAFVNGAGAEALAGFLTNGFDMAKLRLQVQRGAAATGVPGGPGGETVPFRYSGFVSALLNIVRQEGVRGLFRGAGARVLFFVPSQAVSIGCFEYFRKAYDSLLASPA
ncbi:mitochondrial carrier domain-containing protein [Baffinella frigidus]|nr:mitochondrial carrier domain-containing protein [Cryptophyta sp. CCMP2293]